MCFLAIVVAVAALTAACVYLTVPNRNAAAAHFDSLIVLGYPSNPDGTSSPEQRERVLEAVRQLKDGVAAHMIVSGAAAHNRFIEPDAMARLAVSQGVPASAVVEETSAFSTAENIRT